MRVDDACRAAILLGWIIAASYLLVALVRRMAGRLRLFDRPHARGGGPAYRPLPRLGGFGIAAAIAMGMAVARVVAPDWIALVPPMVWLASGLAFAVGAIDDCHALAASRKLVLLTIAAAACFCGGVRLHEWPLFGGTMPLAVSAVVTIGWLVALPTALNFVDGLDGLAAGLTMIGAVVLGIVAVRVGDGASILLAVSVGGAVFGFWWHNRHPAVIFMGDGGSLLLGMLLGIVSLRLVAGAPSSSSVPIHVAVALAWPLVDLVAAMHRRLARSDLFSTDASHLHHQLCARYGHRDAVRLIVASSTTFAAAMMLAPSVALVLVAVAMAATFGKVRVGSVMNRHVLAVFGGLALMLTTANSGGRSERRPAIVAAAGVDGCGVAEHGLP